MRTIQAKTFDTAVKNVFPAQKKKDTVVFFIGIHHSKEYADLNLTNFASSFRILLFFSPKNKGVSEPTWLSICLTVFG